MTELTGREVIAVIDAPSNLGLRPPAPGLVPGCAKLPGALRDHGLVRRLDAEDAGCVTAPRYDVREWQPGSGVRNAKALRSYSVRLADRLELLTRSGKFMLVLGGDCSILVGIMLALRRSGPFGLAFVDAHSDFRHPGNSSDVGAAAGEDLALVTGRGQADLTAIEDRRPYVRDEDVAVIGLRSTDPAISELRSIGAGIADVEQIRRNGARVVAEEAVRRLGSPDVEGFWLHLDVDVLDAVLMPAVDSPEPNGLSWEELATVLDHLVASPTCIGMDVSIFDPDLDPDGRLAKEFTDLLVRVLRGRQGQTSAEARRLLQADGEDVR
jgi:arginase